MFHQIRNLIYLMPHLIGVALKYQRLPNIEIDEVDLTHLDQKQKERVKYYVFLNRLIIEAFAILRDKKLSNDEIEMGALLGAFTPIYDDLMDDEGYKHGELLTETKEGTAMKSVFAQMIKQIKLKHPNQKKFDEYFEAAGIAQDESITLQKNQQTSLEKLRQIMNVKGGNFCLLFRSGLTNEISPQEEKAVYQLGGLTQYVNDIFDIRKDHLDGLITLPIKMESKQELRLDYEKAIHVCYESFKGLNYNSSNTRNFLLRIHLMLSRGLVALDQLESVQNQKPFDIDSLTRKELVCDMEEVSNLVKNVKYTISL